CEAVARDVVRDAKALARHGIEVAPVELVRRRERHGVHEDVEPVPALRKAGEERVDLAVVGNVERQREVAAELLGHVFDAALELVGLIAEREIGALAAHGLGDAPGERAVAREADDDRALPSQKPHQLLCSVTSTNSVSRWPSRRMVSAAPTFHSASFATVTWKRRAIDDSESPERTTYLISRMRSFSENPATVSVRATRACAVLLVPEAGASVHITSERPTLRTSPGAMAFQLASARMSTPYVCAIDHSVSPPATTCSWRTPLRASVFWRSARSSALCV